MSAKSKSGGPGCGLMLILILTVWAIWSITAGEPIWEWVKK